MPKPKTAELDESVDAQPETGVPLLPKPPDLKKAGGEITSRQFLDYLESLTTEDWAHCTVYLYRQWPYIDRHLPVTDPTIKVYNYIEKFVEKFTEDDILYRHGSGKYKLTLCDTNRPKSSEVCNSRLTIKDENFPPVVKFDELVIGHPDNKSFVDGLRARGLLPAEGKEMPAQSSDSATAQALASLLREAMQSMREKKPEGAEALVLQKVIDMMSKANDKSIEMAMRQVKPEATTTEQIALFDRIAGLVEKMGNKPVADDGTKLMLNHVLEELRDERKANHEMMTELFKRRQPSEDEPRGFTKTVMEKLMERALDGLDGGGGGSGKFDWREMIPLAVDRLAPGINGLFGGLGFLMRRAAGGAAPPPPAGNPAQPEIPAAIPGQPQGDPATMMLAEIAGPLVQHLLDPEATGTDFALWFVRGNKQLNGAYSGGYGVRAHSDVVTMGKEKLLGMAKMFPPLWAQIEPVGAERIDAFLDEFLAFDDEAYEPPDDDEPPEPNAAGPQAVPRKRGAKKGEGT